MKKISNALRYIETALFIAMFFCGLISSQLEICVWVGFLGILLFHMAIDHEYAHEWTDFIFGKN